MSDTFVSQGSCLCGAASFTAKKISKEVGACHCSMCRKWGGAAYLAVDCGDDVVFDAESSIATYDSSEWAERGFCYKCGSHLFYRMKQNQQHIMPVGLFNDDDQFVFDHQIFIDEKPEFYCFSNKTTNMTGAEVFAKFAPPAEI